MLKKETRDLAAWAKTVERIINITKREKKKHPKESLIMERFLNLRTHKPQRPPIPIQNVNNPRRFPQELQPD
jgi:hypothetical protein